MKRVIIITVAAAALLLAFLKLRDDTPSRSTTEKTIVEDGPESAEGEVERGLSGTRKRASLEPATRISAQRRQLEIRGLVVDRETRTPVPQVDVILQQGREEITVTSDSAGAFTVQVAAGAYQLRAVGDGVIASKPMSMQINAAATIELEVDRMATLRGVVRYDDGSAAVGAEVTVRKDQPRLAHYLRTGELFPAEVDSSGSFELLLPPGSWRLRANDEKTSAFATVESLKPGELREQFRIVIDRSARLSGKVLLPTAEPAAGAEVFISARIPGTEKFDRVSIHSDAGGAFTELNLRPGPYVVEAILPGYGASAPAAFQLARGQNKRAITLRLNDALRLAGTVVNQAGEPLANVDVAHNRRGSKQRYDRTMTGKDGRFDFGNLGPGPHMIRARKEGFVEKRLDELMAPQDDMKLVMPLAGRIFGRVSSSKGASITQFSVRAKRARDQKELDFLDEGGEYELPLLQSGSFDLVFAASGYQALSMRDVELKPGQNLRVDAELKPR